MSHNSKETFIIGTERMFHLTIIWFQIVIKLWDWGRGGRKYQWKYNCDTCQCPSIGRGTHWSF